MRVDYKKSLAVASTLLTVTTWIAMSVGAQASEPVQQDDCACVESHCGCDDQCHSGCPGGAGGGCLGACSMPPHYMYFPQSHGNYYFRPYNYHTILRQQQSVGRYGGDRRNPYDNSLFEQLYQEVNNDSEQEEVAVPDPISAASTQESRTQEPAPIIRNQTSIRDQANHPAKVHVEPVLVETVIVEPVTVQAVPRETARATSSGTAFRARFVTDK